MMALITSLRSHVERLKTPFKSLSMNASMKKLMNAKTKKTQIPARAPRIIDPIGFGFVSFKALRA